MIADSWKRAASAACVFLLASTGLAQITSPDGLWVATLDNAAGGRNGQITDLSGPNGGGGADNVFESLWYEATSTGGMLTRRVEGNYNQVSENIGAHSATFELLRNDGLLRLDVSLDMVDGPTGGLLHELVWTNVSNNAIDVKPFAYVDLDVDGAFPGQDSRWLLGTSAVEQTNPGSGAIIWFGSTGHPYKSWEIAPFALLRTDLDNGTAQLRSSGGGVGDDFSSAVSGVSLTLQPGESNRLKFAIGGVGITGGEACEPCDMNCDGEVTAFDIEPFLDLLFAGADPCCGARGAPPFTGDVNGDGLINAFDIEPFLACLFP